MGTKSTPMMRDVSGIVFDATCNEKHYSFSMSLARVTTDEGTMTILGELGIIFCTGDVLYLQPSSGCGTEVHEGLAVAKDVILLVQLYDFEGGSRAIPACMMHGLYERATNNIRGIRD